MGYGKIQTVATFSDNQDYSDPLIRTNHTTTLTSPTEALTFRAQAGPYGADINDGMRSLIGNIGFSDLAGGASIENVQQTIVTNRSTDTTVYLLFTTVRTSATSLVVNVDADGGQGSYGRLTRNTGSWDWVSDYYATAGAYLQLTAAPSGANSAKGGAGKNAYPIVDVGSTTLDVQSTSFSDSTGETISMAILNVGILQCPAGSQIIIPGPHPSVALGEGNGWAAFTTSGTADIEFTMIGTT
tara:strand:+ start:80 stop:805 length:726 start_codon:yes stop_codon:yes gene_type:complete